jgi:hypothetical protein
MEQHKSGCGVHHSDSLFGEILAHLPYAIFSVAFGLTILSVMDYFTGGASKKGAKLLFHSFHFLHLIFAVTGSLITFSRFSNNLFKGIVVSLVSAIIFCTLSDVVMPALFVKALGVDVHLHLCFISELHNVIPFLAIGLLNGIVMSYHSHSAREFYSVTSHFSHILVSSLASLFYLISHGFIQWYENLGLLYILLILAVVIPCTMADIVVPVFFARSGKKV